MSEKYKPRRNLIVEIEVVMLDFSVSLNTKSLAKSVKYEYRHKINLLLLVILIRNKRLIKLEDDISFFVGRLLKNFITMQIV